MKRIAIIIVSSIIIIASAICIYFGVSNSNNVDLRVSIENVSVNVGEKEKINFTVSEKSAVVTFEVENENYAEILQENSNYYVVGLAAGQTRITIKVAYGKYRNEESADLSVLSMPGTNDDYYFTNLNNLSFDENVFTLNSNQGNFSISPKNDYHISSKEVTCTDSNVSITTDIVFGLELYFISCSTAGTYQISVNVNGIVTNYTLIVNN